MLTPPALTDLIVAAHLPEPNEHVSFLLGSGFSRPDDLPTVGEMNVALVNMKQDGFY
jgi:hypothetical protein